MEDLQNNIIRINFQAFLKAIWKEKYYFLLIFILFVSLGLWYAFYLPEQFTSEGKILPEVQSKNNKFGGLSGLASLAGVDIATLEGTEAIRPDLYPDILKSTPFFLSLLHYKVTTKNNKNLTFEQFYHQMIEKGKEIPERKNKRFPVKENGFLVLNQLNEDRILELKERIQANIDKKSGIITISVKMPDPVVSADIAHFSMVYLTEYIKNYRVDKLKKDLDFLEERVNMARGKFYSNQTKKAQYSDQFQLPTIRLQSADVQRERIESEYRMSSSFYNELLKKYEEAKIKLQQETPVFQILEPPRVPTRKSEPKKLLILLGAMFLGSVLGLVFILLKNSNFKQIIYS
ncbi:GNVR domain-containing protein [Emticicia sp. BO119]|uniref:GNVR domain-containing protein n=1 Tax=Emticicia sp. BO119 TaxID=2757768 RepID=UPI0015F05010|nr:GNVR domain-containing protein [Emticicia sp. BO119]MBA4854106.1 lipopolysaccharide biosynthesis protein [Emticicia sp. BO119]